MSEAKHTEGPLEVKETKWDDDRLISRWIGRGQMIIATMSRGLNDKADAERLVHCWNAHDKLVAENKTLTVENEKVTDIHADYCHDAHKGVGKLQAKLQAKEERIAELNADKVQLENDACVARGEIERLKKENKKDIADFNDILNRRNKSIDRLTTELANAQQPASASQRLYKKLATGLAEENKALTERIATMRRIDSETRDQNARNYAKVKSLNAEKKTLTAEVARLNYYIDVVLREMKELRTKLNTQAERIAELEKRPDFTRGTRKDKNIRMKHLPGCDWYAGECDCGANDLNAQTDRLTEANKKDIADFNDILNRRNKSIVRLIAVNKRLRSRTDCETESGGILCIEQEDKILAQVERIAELERYERFYQHIEAHLTSDRVVICKICGKSLADLEIERAVKGEKE